MKAYLIKTDERVVEEVELPAVPSVANAYDLLRVESVEAISLVRAGFGVSSRDVLLVDEEGLLPHRRETRALGAFTLGAYPTALVGRGLVLGLDRHGDWCTPSVSITKLRAALTFWHPPQET